MAEAARQKNKEANADAAKKKTTRAEEKSGLSNGDDSGDDDNNDDDLTTVFAPEKEAELLAEANKHKAEANARFARANYDAALTAYETAVAVLPHYLYYDLAVLRSNMAACHLKLCAWKEAIQSATDALTALDKADAEAAETEKKRQEQAKAEKVEEEEEADEEVVSAGAAAAGAPIPTAPAAEPTLQDRLRIRAKALLRRARARAEQGGWANLAGAEEDYRTLEETLPRGTLGAADLRTVQTQRRVLPARTKAAQETETAEMWGKLKELGNGLLRPFGMSTDNFQMVQDEKTGGYSMKFKS